MPHINPIVKNPSHKKKEDEETVSDKPKQFPVPDRKLSDSEKEELYRTFVSWFSKPKKVKKEMQQPLTIQDFCIQHNISPEVIAEFWNRTSFVEDIQENIFQWANSKTPEVLNILLDNIKNNGKSADIRAWLEYVGKKNQKKEDDGTSSSQTNYYFFDVPDENKQAIAQRILSSRKDAL